MSSLLADILIGLTSGLIAGIIFFGGLRWTVARLSAAKRPALLAAVSFVVRSALLAAVLVIPADGNMARIVVALGGILIVRTVMVRAVKRDVQAVEGSPWI